jgi:hypothetical protein
MVLTNTWFGKAKKKKNIPVFCRQCAEGKQSVNCERKTFFVLNQNLLLIFQPQKHSVPPPALEKKVFSILPIRSQETDKRKT